MVAWWHFVCFVKLWFLVSFDVLKHVQVHIVQCEFAHHIHRNTYNFGLDIVKSKFFTFCNLHTVHMNNMLSSPPRNCTIEINLNIAYLFFDFFRLIVGTTCSVEMKCWNVMSFTQNSKAAIFNFSTMRLSFSTTTNYTFLLCYFYTLTPMRITNNHNGIL